MKPTCLVLWGLSLGVLLFSGITHPVPIRTEGLRIAIAEQMTQTGNWVVPHLWGEPILTKPPGFYWALSLAQYMGGANSLAVLRMVSVFAMIGMALIAIWYLGFGRENRVRDFIYCLTALAATLASMGQVPSAEMDIPFSFWILWFWMAALDLGKMGKEISFRDFVMKALVLGLLGGVSILFKWTAPAFFIPAWLWLTFYSPITLSRKFLGTTLCLLGVCLVPGVWLGAVLIQVDWGILRDAVMAEALPHLSPAHHTRTYPFLEWITFPMQIIAMGLPASIALVLPLWNKGLKAGKAFLSPWPFILLGSLLIWTLIPGHRPRHALPVALGFAIVAFPHWLALIRERPKFRVFLVGLLLVLGTGKLIYSFGTNAQRKDQHQIVNAAGEMGANVGGEILALDRIKEDGFVWLTRIPNVIRVSEGVLPNWILCDQNQKEGWMSQGYVIRSQVELSRHTVLFLLFREPKS